LHTGRAAGVGQNPPETAIGGRAGPSIDKLVPQRPGAPVAEVLRTFTGICVLYDFQ